MNQISELDPLSVDSMDAAIRWHVHRLHEVYAACLDAADFDAWPDFFTDDCRYRVQSAENHARGLPHAPIYCEGKGMLRDRVSATRVMVYEPRRQRRFLSGLRILDTGPVIRSTVNIMLTEAMIDRDPVLALTGCYIDEMVVDQGTLRFRDRLCVYDNYRVMQNLIFPI